MADYKQYAFTGKCPYLETQHTIKIKYAELPMSGSLFPGYKKMGYDCEYAPKCPHKDQYKRCVVYINAPNDPNLL